MAKQSKKQAMTDKQYLAQGGGACPACKSYDVEGGAIDVDGPSASCIVRCNACKAEWQDLYRLIGYQGLELQVD